VIDFKEKTRKLNEINDLALVSPISSLYDPIKTFSAKTLDRLLF